MDEKNDTELLLVNLSLTVDHDVLLSVLRRGSRFHWLFSSVESIVAILHNNVSLPAIPS